MSAPDDKGMLLGRNVPAVDVYSPGLLHPVPRQLARDSLCLPSSGELPFSGEDIWHAYELSWLDAAGKPVVRVGRLRVPADTENLVESKSIKLYLNSLNSERYSSDDEVAQLIERDLSAVAGGAVICEVFDVGDAAFDGSRPPGECIDGFAPTGEFVEPARDILRASESRITRQVWHSHLLRSLCPVTGQPDWATLCVDFEGSELEPASLLAYVISFRRHQEFHEQCVERIFCDIDAVAKPRFLSVQALYTRRGGLDICPWRSSEAGVAPGIRTNRQ